MCQNVQGAKAGSMIWLGRAPQKEWWARPFICSFECDEDRFGSDGGHLGIKVGR